MGAAVEAATPPPFGATLSEPDVPAPDVAASDVTAPDVAAPAEEDAGEAPTEEED